MSCLAYRLLSPIGPRFLLSSSKYSYVVPIVAVAVLCVSLCTLSHIDCLPWPEPLALLSLLSCLFSLLCSLFSLLSLSCFRSHCEQFCEGQSSDNCAGTATGCRPDLCNMNCGADKKQNDPPFSGPTDRAPCTSSGR